MRFTSSARRGIAGLLCVLILTISGSVPGIPAEPPERSLILTFYATDIPEATARGRMESISRLLLSRLRVAPVPIPSQADRSGKRPDPPEADGPSLERISARLGEAARRMERMETGEAELLLDESERDARSFRPGESLRPYLAEIFLRRGLLLLWSGNRAGAEDMFGRVRVLRPGFTPDPALFSPAFRESWSRAETRPPAGAEILVQSIPSGADIFVGGTKAGVTPGRVRVPVLSPVVIRLAHAGYLPVERSGHWLPGDSEMLDVALTRDRMTRLEELLAGPAAGKEAGGILGEMALSAGAERVGVFVLTGNGPKARVRVLSIRPGDEEPAEAGEFGWPEGEDGTADAAAAGAALLKAAGWPAASGDTRASAPWYHKWWVWALLGVAVAGAAAGAGGGGGSSGGSSGAIGVEF